MIIEKKRFVWFLLIICGLFFVSFVHRTLFFSHPSSVSCKEILLNTVASVEKIKALKFNLKVAERIKGKLKQSQSHIKLSLSPKKIYLNLDGPEVLWVQGMNNGNALVNPAGFPYMNLNLDPLGSLMRENQHHTIYEIGFDYFSDIIKNSILLSGNDFEKYFKCGGTLVWNNRECYFITAEYPDFQYLDYTVQKGENLTIIARKLKVSEFMILELNSAKVNNYHDVKANQKIQVPNVYGSKMILYIDKEFLLPRIIKVYDEKGLFESYEYHDLQVNPNILDEEFTKGYKEYGF